MSKWRLKRTKQCSKCPWKVSTNPHEIPDGYSVEKHLALDKTIAKDTYPVSKTMKIFACHAGDQEHCIGWLVNQLGPGNNIPLRIRMINCENAREIKTYGAQHQNFQDTLPKNSTSNS